MKFSIGAKLSIQDYSDVGGPPPGLFVMLLHRKLKNLRCKGDGGWGGVQHSWFYEIPKSKIVRVYEDWWKYPHKNWEPDWIYASVPDELLEIEEVKL